MSRELFGRRCAVIGMVHTQALPGSPHHSLSTAGIIDGACREARLLAEAGVDALLIENMHDRPYLRGVAGPQVVSMMTAIACAIRREIDLPCGVQVLAGANEEAIAVALAAGLDFIRAEGFVFAHVADEGVIESCAGRLLRVRRSWGAEGVRIFCDIKKKHSSHAITADISLAETAKAAEFFCADGVIITGTATGEPVDAADLAAADNATTLPVLVGSGATLETIDALFEHSNAVIVGSYFKQGGRWDAAVDPARVKSFVDRVQMLRAV
ncbi:MAG TPA: BtpA/SgcQ family protein [Chthoniobacterales bacterium]